ncbi:hypothetical protein K438DRAFT_1874365, partial [Mycena galopus ATCC 62051]
MDALIGGEGAHVGEGKTVVDDIKANYEKAVTDEFLKPVIVNGEEGRKNQGWTDILFFFNYRSDRMHARARYVLVLPDKPMEVTIPKNLAVTNVPAEWLAKQAHVAETEKYAHLTFFFKGGIEKHFMQRSGVATYDLQSGMTVVHLRNGPGRRDHRSRLPRRGIHPHHGGPQESGDGAHVRSGTVYPRRREGG